MICQFCEDSRPIPQWSKSLRKHLVVTIDNHKHMHVHGDLDDKVFISDLMMQVASMANIPSPLEMVKKIIEETPPESSTPSEPDQSQ